MNYRFLFNQLGKLLLVLGGAMILSEIATFALVKEAESAVGPEAEADARWALFIAAGIGVFVGGLLWVLTRRAKVALNRREALLLVAMSWVMGAVLAALPYFLWTLIAGESHALHPFRNFVNCFFESTSGLTTVGATILTEIESVPESLLFWRAATQWIGGIGIVLVFVAILPTLGASARKLYTFEVSGPTTKGLLPTVRATAQMLAVIYVGLTLAQVIALCIAGMSVYDAICHAFTTIATGGFSPRNASIGAYDSVAVDIIIVVFMVLGGINFALYFAAIRGRWRNVLSDPELRLYLLLLAGGSIVVALAIAGKTIVTSAGADVDGGFWHALRYASFNVVSVQSTTGYATANYDLWSNLPRGVMCILILVGGSAGSTAGGLKVIRIIIAAKILMRIVERAFRPQVVRPIRVGGTAMSTESELDVLAYILGALILLSAATLALMVLEPSGAIDVTTAASANIACFSTTGPGFGGVGPVSNFGWMQPGSKLVLTLMMLLGRLEIFTVIVLVLPRFWKID